MPIRKISHINYLTILQSYILILLSWAPKHTMKQEIITENLYQIPTCTICLQELSENLSCLECGHVFHYDCIMENFEYREFCPNCKNESYEQEVREFHFPLQRSSYTNAQLRSSLLSCLDLSNPSERKQAEYLLDKVKELSEKNQRLMNEVNQIKQKQARQLNQMKGIRDQLIEKDNEVQETQRLNKRLIKKMIEMNKSLKYREWNQERLKNDLAKLKDQKNQNKFEYLRNMDKLSDYSDQLNDKQFQITKLKRIIDKLKKDTKKNKQKIGDRRRQANLKEVQKLMTEKGQDNDISEMEDVQISVEISDVADQNPLTEYSIIQSALKKPKFNQTGLATIGGFGFRKKQTINKPKSLWNGC